MTNEELAEEIRNGNGALMDQLWRQCYGFVCQQAIRWQNVWKERPGFDIDDLKQAGYFALDRAVRGYDKDRGSFITLLSFYLKREFQKVTGCYTAKANPLDDASSLDAPAYNDPDNDVTLGEITPDNDASMEDVENAIYDEYMKNTVREAVSSIPEQQSKCVDMCYLQGKTYQDAAEALGITTSAAKQLIQSGLVSLRKSQYIPELTEIYYGSPNYYSCTGYNSFKQSGMSSPERELIYKEYWEMKYEQATWSRKVSLLRSRYGLSIEKAQIIASLDDKKELPNAGR